jgi:hypothetical protein
MAISVLKTWWGVTKGFFTGGPIGAVVGGNESVAEQVAADETPSIEEDIRKGEEDKAN